MRFRIKTFVLFCLFGLAAFANSDRFFKFTNSHINNIYQDREGFVWMCSDYGLTRFSGSETKTFYHSSDSTSLISNSVLTIMEDRSGDIWVGTTAGIQRFDRKTEKFHSLQLSYPHVSDFTYVNSIIEDRKGNIWFTTSRSGIICLKAETREPVYYLKTNSNICSNKINTLYEDRFGNIWIGSQDNGISILNPDNQMLTNYSHNSGDLSTLSSNTVFAISETPDGQVLVGTIDGGIDAFDYSSRRFRRNYIPCEGHVFTFRLDRQKRLWIGTDGSGLKSYDFATKELTTYKSDLQNFDFEKIKVHCVFEDRQGNIWAAVYQKGVLMIPHEKKRFFNIGFNPFSPANSIGAECVLSIMEDRSGDIWIGTDGEGVFRLDRDRKVKRNYSGSGLPAGSVMALLEDSKGNIWAGSYLYGLYRYNPAGDAFVHVTLKDGGEEVKDINTLAEGPDGRLWIGTNGNGLCIYDPAASTAQFFKYNLMVGSGQILGNSIHAVFFDAGNHVWLGTSEAGLSRYDLSDGSFTDYNVANGRLSDNSVYSIAQDGQGQIWVGTKSGLNRIDLKSGGKPTVFTTADGLANETIYGIEIDGKGNFWMSTCMGLSYLDSQSGKFTSYNVSDGIVSDEFKRGASFQSASGEIFFGGVGGVTSFRPFKIERSRPLLNLVFTDLYVYNNPVEAGDSADGLLEKPLNVAEEIRLPYGVNNFSIGYSAIEFNYPNKVVYEVMLENLDDGWITQPLNTRLSTYTNLKPGKYVFHVRASIAGEPSMERHISIIIEPPLWQTWWAKTIYALLFAGIVFFVIKYIRDKMKSNKERLEKANEKRMMESKIQFFTDISHEIRTPLTLILSPIERLIGKTSDKELLKVYQMIDQNGKRILRLINQIMELRKLDNSETRLLAAETDVAKFLRDVCSSYNKIAEEKQIDYRLEVADNLPRIWLDRDKIDKVVFNVLSNAFKYTPEGGSILVTANINGGYNGLFIKIKDSGTGIPEQYRTAIFERFYQVPTESNRTKLGTGIGLHLSHKLMKLHHGDIYVEESSEKGTTFVVRIPVDTSYLKPEERSEDSDDSTVALANLNQPSLSDYVGENPSRASARPVGEKNVYTVLLVEDDVEIQRYLSDILKADYRILCAGNGKEGLEMAVREKPDCVVTDIMMPEMDGTEMCRILKQNSETCDIPVIILTAKTSVEQRVAGLQGGADSYIPKPFNVEHLQTRVWKLIELRKTMKDKYSGKLDVKEENVKIKSADEKLLQRVADFVDKELANPDLSVELIASEIGVSRSQLHRKLKQLTGQNPSDYIKGVRLRHAAYLLSHKNVAVSEAGYATGFSSLSHFSNSFKEFYGMSPTKYVEVNRGKEEN